MDFRRIKQVCRYGWNDAKSICREENLNRSRCSIFMDILHCFFKYNVWSNQYKKDKLYLLAGEKKKEICLKYQKINAERDVWVKEFFDNYKFLNKWSDFKYEKSAALQSKRRSAYQKQYGLGDNCFVGYGVILQRNHYIDSVISTGKDCFIAENTNIDYTGGLILEDHVSISEDVKILTHNHELNFDSKELRKGCILTPLVIRDNAWIGTRAIIMPGVKEIGRGAIISAGTYVNFKVPPYAVLQGNPAKIVGFKFTPDEMINHEANIYPLDTRTDFKEYERLYNKYFINRITEIKKHINL
jgi:acetyltransferase-like isoleucine patch superfamily enzyme